MINKKQYLVNTLAATSLLVGLSSCVTYAKRDYSSYPGQEKNLAVENLENIAQDICLSVNDKSNAFKNAALIDLPRCNALNFNNERIEYVHEICDPSTRVHTSSGYNCNGTFKKQYLMEWDDIRKIVASAKTVKICEENKDCVEIVGFWRTTQADDFAEALNVYLQHR